MQRDEEHSWEQQHPGARWGAPQPGESADEWTESQPVRPPHGERAIIGRIVESVSPPLPRSPQRRVLAGICAALLVVVLSVTFAVVRAGSGPGRSGAHGNGTTSGGTNAHLTPTENAPGTQPLQLPPGVPSYFSFGVMNAPGDVALLDDMRTHNGTAWDYRYQYLAGGVNTGQGWETWNSPTGAFASLYMQESASHHYIPAFVYYELRQSNGTCGGCSDAPTDLANLNNPSLMGAYFANWRLLMREIGDFG
ncbi:MAG TPA: hypothetical protein VKT52_00040, partial [Ktedonobacterales bacterium]|nr:hypothetical protein [Ktedonobacterales bacterium]